MKLFKVIMALFAIGTVVLSFNVCSLHYIVFEDVGQVATSLTYHYHSLEFHRHQPPYPSIQKCHFGSQNESHTCLQERLYR